MISNKTNTHTHTHTLLASWYSKIHYDLYSSVLAITSEPAIEDGSKSTNFMWTSSPRFAANNKAHDLQWSNRKCWFQYQIPKISAALRRLFGLASANTEISSVFTLKRLWIRVWKRWNTSKALGNRCRFTKGHHKDKQGDYNNKPRSAMHHTTPQQESTSCSGSRRLSTVHTVDTLRNNLPPLELREFQVECTTESLYQLAFTQL